MSKIKAYIESSVEKQVDTIIANLKSNMITESSAIKEILDIDNLNMVGIDENNIEEVLNMELASANISKADLLQENA